MIDLSKTIDLSTTYLGLKLKNPLVASSSPMCENLDNIRRIEDAGAAAIVLHSLFEEQIELESEQLDRFIDQGSELSPEAVTATELAGEKITAKLTRAPGNGAAIGGLKVLSPSGWFAARPSGTENLYKLYAESLKSAEHLAAIVDQAQEIVSRSLAR